MPAIARKRRAPALADSDDEESTPVPAQSPRRPNRRASPSADEDDSGDDREQPVNPDSAERDADAADGQSGTRNQIVKDLVRLALASEYSRTPIRRTDISAKVLGREGRQFREVFAEAQMALRHTFGMELVELPAREKITLKERRAAQTVKAPQSSAWILRSVLPDKFTTPEILPPPKVPTRELEAAYVGLYSFVVAVITLNGGTLPEAKLERYLGRTNTDVNMPVGTTEKVLLRMIRDGYIVRTKDNSGGEEVVEYMVGTRGKMEVGEQGVEKLIRNVYGRDAGEDEELEKRIERSLKVGAARTQAAVDGSTHTQGHGQGPGQGQVQRSGRRRRGAAAGTNSGEDEEYDGD